LFEIVYDFKLTSAEREKLDEAWNPGGYAAFLVNDYYSWPKELYHACVNGSIDKIVNAIPMIMRYQNLTLGEATKRLAQIVLEYEKEFQHKLDDLAKDPTISLDLHRAIELLPLLLGGNHLWSTRSPRYHGLPADSETILAKFTKDCSFTELRAFNHTSSSHTDSLENEYASDECIPEEV